jgi:branched-chain amino acid transport system permease protein
VTQFLNYLVGGIARGAIYALIALGFVIVYRSTHVLNFAQGAIMGLGGYFTYMFSGPVANLTFASNFHVSKLPYWVAVFLAMIFAAGIGWLIERLIVRKFRGRPIFAAVMAMLGVNILIEVVAQVIWGSSPFPVRHPFGGDAINLGIKNVAIRRVDFATLIITAIVATAFFVFFKRSKIGTAMRATSMDQEAAMAQGISANFIFGISWAIACALGALAGILLSSAPDRQVDTAIPLFALVGFPAIVLGGIDSTEGAIAGGMLIGIVEGIAAGYEPKFAGFTGNGFFALTPYLLMLLILLVKPTGFFGTEEVRRV